VVGTAMVGYDGHRGWIYSIGVAPAQRRKGYARALLSHAEAQLRGLGCPKINFQVLAANEPALRFWHTAGYQPDHVVSLGRRL
jgi:ribosomal protein S18 acetylase RimI-like enzyme